MPALVPFPAPAEDGDGDCAEGEQRGDREEGVAEAGWNAAPPAGAWWPAATMVPSAATPRVPPICRNVLWVADAAPL